MNRKSGGQVDEVEGVGATEESEIKSEARREAAPADPPKIPAPPFGMSSRKSKRVLIDLQGTDKKEKPNRFSGNQQDQAATSSHNTEHQEQPVSRASKSVLCHVIKLSIVRR